MNIKETEIEIVIAEGKKPKKLKRYILTPDDGCILQNKRTGRKIYSFIVVHSEKEIADYEDVIE